MVMATIVDSQDWSVKDRIRGFAVPPPGPALIEFMATLGPERAAAAE